MTSQYEDSIYTRSVITRSICVPINDVGRNIEEHILHLVSKDIEGRCTAEGYIKRNSCKLISTSSGILKDINVVFTVMVECLIFIPVYGMILQCIAKDINNSGIEAVSSIETPTPFKVFIARDHFYKDEKFLRVKENDKILVKVNSQRYELYDSMVSIIGELYTEDKKPRINIKKKKIVVADAQEDNLINAEEIKEDPDELDGYKEEKLNPPLDNVKEDNNAPAVAEDKPDVPLIQEEVLVEDAEEEPKVEDAEEEPKVEEAEAEPKVDAEDKKKPKATKKTKPKNDDKALQNDAEEPKGAMQKDLVQETDDAIYFFGIKTETPYKVFSNYFQSPLVMDNISFTSLEHYLVYNKWLMFDADNKPLGDKILQLKTPDKIHTADTKIIGDEEAWKNRKTQILKPALYNKFYQNTIIKDILVATGDKQLYFADSKDGVFGIKLTAKQALKRKNNKGFGENILGKLLMEVREELR